MEKNLKVLETVSLLQEKTESIYKSRIEQLQEDEQTLKEIINRLASECSLFSSSTRKDEDKIAKDYQKAREDRDEYKFKLHLCENKIKELEDELATSRMNQTQQCFSVSGVDIVQKLNSTNTQINSEVENSMKSRAPPENLDRELQYLHEKNREFFEENRRLKCNLKSQSELNKKLSSYEEEISTLKSIIDTKNTKIMELQIESEEKLKKAKLEFEFMLSSKINSFEEMHKAKCDLQISLQEAQEEIKLLKQMQVKQIKEDSERRNTVLSVEKGIIPKSQTIVSGHNTPKLDVLHRNINIRIQHKDESSVAHAVSGHSTPKMDVLHTNDDIRIKTTDKSNLKSIENINTEDISVIEKRQEEMDEIHALPVAAENGKSRGRNVRKASRNATAEIKKQAEMSVENAGKAIKPKARKKAKGNMKAEKTEKNKISTNSEADENEDPCCPTSSRSLAPAASGKEKHSKSKLPVTKNSIIKEMDSSNRQTQRRRNV